MTLPTDDEPGSNDAKVADYIDFVVFRRENSSRPFSKLISVSNLTRSVSEAK
jgi:hypothetical protein